MMFSGPARGCHPTVAAPLVATLLQGVYVSCETIRLLAPDSDPPRSSSLRRGESATFLIGHFPGGS